MKCIGCGEERPDSEGVRLLVTCLRTEIPMCLDLCSDAQDYRRECLDKWSEKTRMIVKVGSTLRNGDPMPALLARKSRGLTLWPLRPD